MKHSFSAWALASFFSPMTFLPRLLCASSSHLCPGEMTFPRGEPAGKAASFWGKPLFVCSPISGLGLGRLKWDPCPQEGLWRPRLLISRFSSFKGPISFQQGEFICKTPRRSRRQIPAQLAFRARFFYGWTCPGSNPVFCLLICSCKA